MRIAQNSQQKSVPDLNVLTVAFLALKNGFSEEKKIPPQKNFFLPFFMQLFSADTMIFSFFFIFCPWKHKKKRSQKLLIIGPKLFFSCTGWRPKPARFDFSYYKYVLRLLSWRSPLAYVFFPCNRKLWPQKGFHFIF